jgi:hypothetical protein
MVALGHEIGIGEAMIGKYTLPVAFWLLICGVMKEGFAADLTQVQSCGLRDAICVRQAALDIALDVARGQMAREKDSPVVNSRWLSTLYEQYSEAEWATISVRFSVMPHSAKFMKDMAEWVARKRQDASDEVALASVLRFSDTASIKKALDENQSPIRGLALDAYIAAAFRNMLDHGKDAEALQILEADSSLLVSASGEGYTMLIKWLASNNVPELVAHLKKSDLIKPNDNGLYQTIAVAAGLDCKNGDVANGKALLQELMDEVIVVQAKGVLGTSWREAPIVVFGFALCYGLDTAAKMLDDVAHRFMIDVALLQQKTDSKNLENIKIWHWRTMSDTALALAVEFHVAGRVAEAKKLYDRFPTTESGIAIAIGEDGTPLSMQAGDQLLTWEEALSSSLSQRDADLAEKATINQKIDVLEKEILDSPGGIYGAGFALESWLGLLAEKVRRGDADLPASFENFKAYRIQYRQLAPGSYYYIDRGEIDFALALYNVHGCIPSDLQLDGWRKQITTYNGEYDALGARDELPREPVRTLTQLSRLLNATGTSPAAAPQLECLLRE